MATFAAAARARGAASSRTAGSGTSPDALAQPDITVLDAPLGVLGGLAASANASLQRSRLVQREGGTTAAERFTTDHAGHAHLVKGLEGAPPPDVVFSTLIDNFFARIDFSYTGGSQKAWTNQGDCVTLSTEFKETAAYFGLDVTIERSGEVPIFVDPCQMVDGNHGLGNIDGGAGWFFFNHAWVSGAGLVGDPTFGLHAAPKLTIGKESKQGKAIVFDFGGKVVGANKDHGGKYSQGYTLDPAKFFAP